MKKALPILLIATSCFAWDSENSHEILMCQAGDTNLVIGTDDHDKGFVVTFDPDAHESYAENGFYSGLEITEYRDGFHAEWPRIYPPNVRTFAPEAYSIDLHEKYQVGSDRHKKLYTGELCFGTRHRGGRLVGDCMDVTCQGY